MELVALGVAVVVLIALNALFVLAEFAIVRVRPSRVAELVARRVPSADALGAVQRNLDEHLGVCQIGITLASVALGVASQRVAEVLSGAGGQRSARYLVAIAVSYCVVTGSHVLLGELLPKAIAIRMADAAALRCAVPLRALRAVLSPLLWFFTVVARLAARVVRLPRTTDEESHTEQELRILLEHFQERGNLSLRRLLVMENVFAFGHPPLRARHPVLRDDRAGSPAVRAAHPGGASAGAPGAAAERRLAAHGQRDHPRPSAFGAERRGRARGRQGRRAGLARRAGRRCATVLTSFAAGKGTEFAHASRSVARHAGGRRVVSLRTGVYVETCWPAPPPCASAAGLRRGLRRRDRPEASSPAANCAGWRYAACDSSTHDPVERRLAGGLQHRRPRGSERGGGNVEGQSARVFVGGQGEPVLLIHGGWGGSDELAARDPGNNPSGLRLLRRLRLASTIERDRLENERLDGGLVNLFSFMDVDRAAHVSVEARVEEQAGQCRIDG